ncbi:MAG: hypothetical protein WC959_03490 [Kiritimatiellales bacterium]
MNKLICFVSTLAVSISAVTVVDYDRSEEAGTPNTVGNSARNPDVSTPTARMWNFSTTEELLKDDVKGTNNTVYGGMNYSWTAVETNVLFRYYNDAIQLSVGGAGTDADLTGIIFWDKSDFLNNADTQLVGFSGTDSLSASFETRSGGTTWDIRFVINQGGTWYVSDQNITATGSGVFSSVPATGTWHAISTNGNYTISVTAEPITFDNVLAVGLYINGARKNGQVTVRINDFIADATVGSGRTLRLVIMHQ